MNNGSRKDGLEPSEQKMGANERISRREWVGSIANASLVAMGVGAAITGAPPSEAAQQSANELPFDVHQHVDAPVDDKFTEIMSPSAWIEKDHSARVKIMDDNGIAKSVIMPGLRTYRRAGGIESTKKLNDLVAEYVAKHSDRFPVGIGTVEPAHGDASLPELERMAKDLKFRGVVWHHQFTGVAIDSPIMRVILKKMEELKLIPFIHTMDPPFEDIWMMDAIATDFPNMTMVVMDSFGYHRPNIEPAFKVGKKHKNLLFDTGPCLGLFREIGVERFVKELGADRFLFGSDLYATYPSYRHNVTLDILKHSQISDQDRAKILYGNTKKLFGL